MNIQANPVNPEYMDPALFIRIEDTGEAILFDCGEIHRLKVRDIQRITRIFVSHLHIDHFIGFDHIIRMCINIEKTLEVYGPPGIIDAVEHKIRGYAWNLYENIPLTLRVFEIENEKITSVTFPGNGVFPRTPPVILERESPAICREGYEIRSVALDHKIPSLAYSIEAAPSLNIDKNALSEMGLPSGPWIKRLKESFQEGETVELAGKSFLLKELYEKLLIETRGKIISYITDTIFNKATFRKMKSFLANSDEFYCESYYLYSVDRERARENYHMTAKHAGIAAAAGEVKKLFLMHFSRRYEGEYNKLYDEARGQFEGVRKAEVYDGGTGGEA